MGLTLLVPVRKPPSWPFWSCRRAARSPRFPGESSCPWSAWRGGCGGHSLRTELRVSVTPALSCVFPLGVGVCLLIAAGGKLPQPEGDEEACEDKGQAGEGHAGCFVAVLCLCACAASLFEGTAMAPYLMNSETAWIVLTTITAAGSLLFAALAGAAVRPPKAARAERRRRSCHWKNVFPPSAASRGSRHPASGFHQLLPRLACHGTAALWRPERQGR